MGSFINGGLTSGFKEDANMTVARSCHDKERQALLSLKANLVDINSTLNGWDDEENKDCCQYWVGVLCDDDRTGHVTTLDLSTYSYGLSGNISPLLLFLPRLEYLDLSGVDFQFNHIPSSLSSLNNLQYLKISGANLSGSIPCQLANLSNLYHLDLSNNSLSGPIPASFEDSTSLMHLDLSKNQLEGVIPKSILSWPHLTELDLSGNLFNGSVPNFAGCSSSHKLVKEKDFMLRRRGANPYKYNSQSHLTVRSCPYLQKLDLSRNGLTGSLPSSVGKLLDLAYLDVSSNSLEGVISDVHFLNLTQLTYLDLSFNSFAINLSSNACVGFTLRIIRMQSCKLGPSFPAWIQTQRHFHYLDISNTGISDHVPGWFWDLPYELLFLNLSTNEIRGTLPKITSVFDRYPGMDLSNNQLEGTIPLLPSDLAALNLAGNRFSGTLSFVCQMNMALTFLDLSSNLLSGSLPNCWQYFQGTLVVLDLSNNNLSGEIPSSLGFLSRLQALYLRKNEFVGKVPKSLRNCTELRFVDLGENKLSGNIPTWIGERLSKLRVLVLRSNRFNGSLPSQICFLKNLQFLDLSKNELLGNIPRCFGNFTAMATTQFQDDVMSHSYSPYVVIGLQTEQDVRNFISLLGSKAEIIFSYLPKREALFIDNTLVGWKGARREFGRGLFLLKSIDISSNKLYGKLPYEITNLQGLVSLNLSDNKLHGEIPKNMGRLRSLESLDLSRNEFSGNIPLSLSWLTPLSYLDLSYNNLSGRIPLGPQLQLFDSSSYTRNPQLCGSPLTQRCEPPPSHVTVSGKEDSEKDEDEFWRSYYVGMVCGFAVGFLGTCSVLFLNRRCRYFVYASLNNMNDWIYVTAIVHFRRLHRKFRW